MQVPDKAAAQRRKLQQLINDPVLLAFGPVPLLGGPDAAPALNGRFSALHKSQKSLPDNVHLLTTLLLEEGQVLLRLAHLFQVCSQSSSRALAHRKQKAMQPAAHLHCSLRHDGDASEASGNDSKTGSDWKYIEFRH